MSKGCHFAFRILTLVIHGINSNLLQRSLLNDFLLDVFYNIYIYELLDNQIRTMQTFIQKGLQIHINLSVKGRNNAVYINSYRSSSGSTCVRVRMRRGTVSSSMSFAGQARGSRSPISLSHTSSQSGGSIISERDICSQNILIVIVTDI